MVNGKWGTANAFGSSIDHSLFTIYLVQPLVLPFTIYDLPFTRRVYRSAADIFHQPLAALLS